MSEVGFVLREKKIPFPLSTQQSVMFLTLIKVFKSMKWICCSAIVQKQELSGFWTVCDKYWAERPWVRALMAEKM